MSYLKYLLLIFTIFFSHCAISLANSNQMDSTAIQKELAELEASSGGRIGLFAINTANNSRIAYRSEERFPFQSTFKVIGVAAILKQSMADNHLLHEMINYDEKDVVFWSPTTTQRLVDGASGMTIFDLCAAAISYSDDTAINLLVKKLGGPKAVTAFARSIGDHTFRLDGWEPTLNANPDEARDTTTPAGMAESLQQLTLGHALGSQQRDQLISWMKGNTTGNKRIRAGVPQGWIVADKTGSNRHYGITNDIAVVWPPKCAPIVMAIYFSQKQANAPHRDDILASATRLLINEFAKEDSCVKGAERGL